MYSHRLHEWLVSLSEKLQAWWLRRWEFNNVLFLERKLFLNLKIDYKNAIDCFASSGMKSQSFQNSVHGNQKNAFRSNILISRMASLFDPDYCLKVLGVNIDGRLQLLLGIWPSLAYTVYTDLVIQWLSDLDMRLMFSNYSHRMWNLSLTFKLQLTWRNCHSLCVEITIFPRKWYHFEWNFERMLHVG